MEGGMLTIFNHALALQYYELIPRNISIEPFSGLGETKSS